MSFIKEAHSNPILREPFGEREASWRLRVLGQSSAKVDFNLAGGQQASWLVGEV